MTDIEILDTLEPEEMANAVKQECVTVGVDGEDVLVLRLLFPDSTVKFVRNLAISVDGTPSFATPGDRVEYVRTELLALLDKAKTDLAELQRRLHRI